MKVKLILTDKQLRLVLNALEQHFRLCMGQRYCGLADELAFQNVELGEIGTPEREALFDECIDRRNRAEDLLQTFFDICSGRDWRHWRKTPDVQNEIDIYSVIRHFFWEQREKKDELDHWTVDAGTPRQWGSEPLPEIERVEDGESQV